MSSYTRLSGFLAVSIVSAAAFMIGVPVVYSVFNKSRTPSHDQRRQSKSSVRLQKARELLDSYSALDSSALLANFSQNFTHQVLPASLNSPSRDRQAFALHAQGFTKLFSSFAMIPVQMVEDLAGGFVVVHALMQGHLHELGPWENECVMLLKFDGTMIVEMKEFVDSARANLLKEMLATLFSQRKAEELMYQNE